MERDCSCHAPPPRGSTRRDALRFGMAAAGLVALGPLRDWMPPALGAPLSLKRLVVINLFGGNDTMNMVIPHTLQTYFDRRGALALGTQDRLALDSGPAATDAISLHGAMPHLRDLWVDGSVAAVQRVGYPDENLSHFTSQDIFSLGVRDDAAAFGGGERSGWIARFADRYAPTPLGAVSVGVGRPLDFVGGSSNPLLVRDLASFQINQFALPESHLHRLEAAKKILSRFGGAGTEQQVRTALSQSFELTQQVQDAVAAYSGTAVYPNTTVARELKDIATLIQGGFETRIFFTGYGGFDTHSVQGTGTGVQANLLSALDGALHAFVTDLKDMGVWQDTVIVVLTEFGRRNYVNGSSGTDHGHAFCELVLGGPVRGGAKGPDLVDADLLAEYPSYAVDFRSVYTELLQDHLGVDPSPVFPEALEKNVTLDLV